MDNVIARAWRSQFAPRDRRPIYEWARDNVSLHGSIFIPNGPFEIANSRRFIAVFEALLDPYVREVNLLAAVQDGKTIIADIWLPWIIVNDPGPFLGLFQKDDVATDHCKLRTWPVIRSVPAIAAALEGLKRSEACTQEILLPQMPVFINGPVLTNLQSKPFRYLWGDEPWMYRKGTIGQAKGRLTQFVKHGLDKSFFTSQGGFVETRSELETNEWHEQFASGELNEMFVKCRSCRKFHLPVWSARDATDATKKSGFVWDDHRDGRGLWLVEKCKPTLRYVCPVCAHEEPVQNSRAVQAFWNEIGNFEFRVMGEPKRIKKSFHWPGFISFPWENCLDEFLTARNAALMGDRSHLILFELKRLAKMFDATADDEEFDRLPTCEIEIVSGARPVAGREVVPPIQWKDPDTGEEIAFTHRHLMLDVSLRRLWAVASAWSDAGDDITLEAREIPTQPNVGHDWEHVVAMQTRWQVSDQDVGIDVNYADLAQVVTEEIVKHGHYEGEGTQRTWHQWIGYRGDKRPNFRFVTGKKMRLTPVVMIADKVRCPDIERIDPAPGMNVPKSAPEFFIECGDGGFRKKECLVFRWSKPTITAILENRRDGRARSIRSVHLKGDWNDLFFRHMHGERWRVRIDRQNYGQNERYAAGRHDFADCKKMDYAHAIRRGYLIPAGGEVSVPAEPSN